MRFACAVLALLLGASAARADKPTIAVLGVSPKDDASLVKTASALDAALRKELAAKYRVKGTARQIANAIRTAECSTSEASCAAKLGASLGTELALAGELERRGTHAELVISIVDVAKRQRVRTLRDKIAVKANFAKLAKKSVRRLTGADEPGELVVIANVPRAEVFIDDELRGELFEGKTTITLPQGRYKLEIRARGHRPYTDLVSVDGTTKLNVLLD